MQFYKLFPTLLTIQNARIILWVGLVFSFLFPLRSQGQDQYEEVPLLLTARGVGSVELPAAIINEEAYLSVSDLFDFLKIKNSTTPGFDSISGFFIDPSATYLINRIQQRIYFKDKVFPIPAEDLIISPTSLYLKASQFGLIFGLHCSFNFRNLAVLLKTDLELPIIRERRQEQMRQNLKRLKGEVTADTVLARGNPFFRLGMADWTFNSSQLWYKRQQAEQKRAYQAFTRATLALGANLAGGEAQLRLNVASGMPFHKRNQFYQWRYANNDHAFLRQLTLGRINPQATASIFAPVNGVQLTNTATVRRQSFGTYKLSDVTEPNWIVELYINNTLVEYVQADNSGFFSFEVPLVYGHTAVMLKYYGPWGESRVEEKHLVIPFNFLPPGEAEYTLSGGIVEDLKGSRFWRGNLNYGLSRQLTVGGGVEYLSSVENNPFMPFLTSSLNLASGLVLSGEYTQGVRTNGVLRYQQPSGLNLDLTYTRYEKKQKAIFFNYLEERRLMFSRPFQLKKYRFTTQLALNQIVFSDLKSTRAELRLSGSVLGIATSITNYAFFSRYAPPYYYSNIALTHMLPARFNLQAQAQFDYLKGQVVSARVSLERRMSAKGFLVFSYQKDLMTDYKSLEAGFRYNFDFAQTGMTSQFAANRVSLSQSANGGLLFDQNSQESQFNTRSNVGKGGITVMGFLDLNNNGRYDPGEKKMKELNPHIRGGSFVYNPNDTSFTAINLQPYQHYLLEVNQAQFNTISWQIKKKIIRVTVEPNHSKLVSIPVFVAGEVAGSVFNDSDPAVRGRIKINFYRDDVELVGSTLSEEDGYFALLGLTPGQYTARVDSAQLHKIRMVVAQPAVPFTIRALEEGDVVDNLEIHIRQEKSDEASSGVLSGRIRVAGTASSIMPLSLKVNLYRDGTLVDSTTTAKDGTFSFVNLSAGTYTVRPDETQLGALSMKVLREAPPFQVNPAGQAAAAPVQELTIGPK